jgi:hypothetical protein
MNIYLRHDVHGTKVATMELEAVADEENGWVRYTHDTLSAPEEVVPVNTLEVQKRRRKEPAIGA